jgi:hypothetical protein
VTVDAYPAQHLHAHRDSLKTTILTVDQMLRDLLPAGPDDDKPPDDWPHWQLTYKLTHAKLLLTQVLVDLPPQR